MIFQSEHVAGTIGRQVQRDTSAQQDVVGTIEVDQILGDQIEARFLRPPQRLDVAEATVAVLQIGLEVVGDIAGRLLAHTHPITQLRKVPAAVAAPRRQTLSDHLRGQLVVTGERPGGHERRGRVEVGPGEVELLVDPSDGMTELHARVPQRVPDGARNRLDLFGDLLRFDVVDEQQVEVALRGELAAPVAADRQQCDPTGRAVGPCDRFVEDGDHPLVGDLRERPAVVAAQLCNRIGSLCEVTRTNCGRHGTMSAASPIDTRRSASADVEATSERTSSVESISRS